MQLFDCHWFLPQCFLIPANGTAFPGGAWSAPICDQVKIAAFCVFPSATKIIAPIAGMFLRHQNPSFLNRERQLCVVINDRESCVGIVVRLRGCVLAVGLVPVATLHVVVAV